MNTRAGGVRAIHSRDEHTDGEEGDQRGAVRTSSPRTRQDVWTAPIVLGVISAFGLVAALLSDDLGDVLGWISLAVPVVVVVWYSRRRRARDS